MTKKRRDYGTILTKRGNSWAVRVAVPSKLVKAGTYLSRNKKPITSVVKTLVARTHADAKAEALTVEAEIRERFSRLMAGLPADDGTIRQIADAAGQDAYDMLKGRLSVERGPQLRNELGYMAVFGDTDKPNPLLIGSTTDAFVAQRLARLKAPVTPESIDRAGDAVLAAQRAAVEAVMAGETWQPTAIRSRRSPAASDTGGTLLERYLKDRAKNKPLAPSSVTQVRIAFRSLANATGNMPFDAIGRADVNRWVEAMTAPPQELSAASVNRHLGTISKLWTWCQDKGDAGIGETVPNPFTRHWQTVDEDAQRQPFTAEELTRLFAGAVFDPRCRRDFPSCLPWMMAVGAYSGLRQSEITGAKLLKNGEHYYFAVGKGKTASARRNVPCHPELLRLGVVDFYAGGWPPAMALKTAKRFRAHRLACGVDRDKLTFHSLRKTFSQGLDGVVPRDVIAALLGHARGFSLDSYSPTGPHFPILVDAVGKLRFEGLRL